MIRIIFYFLLICCFMFSCTKKENIKKTDSDIVMPEGGGTLVVAVANDVGDWNPLTSITANALDMIGIVFESLTTFDEKLSIIPRLVESWEFSPDFLSITYHLRKGLLWSDGTPITTKDIDYTFKLISNPEINSRSRSSLEMVDKVEIIDDYSIKVTFKELYSDELQDTNVIVLPKHIMEKINPSKMKGSSFSENPLGCGAFKLEKWDRGQQWSLIANENFYRGRSHLDRIIFRVVPDENIRINQLKTGEIDLVESISPNYYADLQTFENINIVKVPQRGYTYIGWNLANPLFQSKKVRQALTMAINREAIIEKYVFGLGEISVVPVLKQSWAYNSMIKPFPYDPDKSKQFLNDEGWRDTDGDGWLDKNGKKFSFVIKYNVDNPIRKNIATYIQENFKLLGIEVKPMGMEWNTYIDDVFNKRNFDAMILAWRLNFTNSADARYIWHSEMIKEEGSNNVISFNNPAVDSLIEIGRKTLDQKKSKLIWDRFQEIIHDEQPYTFVYIATSIHSANKRLRGFEKIDIRGVYNNVDDWWIPLKERRKGDI